MVNGIDWGTPVEEKKIRIEPDDDLKSLPKKAYKAGDGMTYDALKRISDPNYIPDIIDNFGNVYTLPNFRQYLLFNCKMLRREIININKLKLGEALDIGQGQSIIVQIRSDPQELFTKLEFNYGLLYLSTGFTPNLLVLRHRMSDWVRSNYSS